MGFKMKKKIINIKKQNTPFGKGLEQIQFIFDCTVNGKGKRFTSKGSFIPEDASGIKRENAIMEEMVYMKHFLTVLGFDRDYVTNTINEYIDSNL
jgi:hypothetical protein